MTDRSKGGTTAERITRLEGHYSSLQDQIAGARADQAEAYRQLSQALQGFQQEVRKELQFRARVPWQAIGVVAVIVTSLVGLGGWGIIKDLTRLDTETRENAQAVGAVLRTRFSESDGKEVWQAIRLLETEGFDRSAAERMRSEIRDLLNTQAARLQRHVEDGHPARVEAIVDGIEKRLELLEAADRDRSRYRDHPPKDR